VLPWFFKTPPECAFFFTLPKDPFLTHAIHHLNPSWWPFLMAFVFFAFATLSGSFIPFPPLYQMTTVSCLPSETSLCKQVRTCLFRAFPSIISLIRGLPRMVFFPLIGFCFLVPSRFFAILCLLRSSTYSLPSLLFTHAVRLPAAVVDLLFKSLSLLPFPQGRGGSANRFDDLFPWSPAFCTILPRPHLFCHPLLSSSSVVFD